MAGARVAVALGAGGARGYAHIGALQVLKERGLEVVAIAGTSMGALVGGAAAAGKLEEYTSWALTLTQREVFRLLDVGLSGGGAIRLERVIAKVAEILDGGLIEDCAVPFTAVATDLNARREVWFQDGPLETAIRASIAIPTIITPVKVDGRLLVDGGLMNPVPIEPTTAVTADLTVAVSLLGRRAEPPDTAQAERPPQGPLRALSQRLPSLFREDPAPGAVPEVGPAPDPRNYALASKEMGSMELFSRSFDTMAALIARHRMASNPPDVLVTVPSDACRTMEFHRAAEMIELGRELTEKALDAAGQ